MSIFALTQKLNQRDCDVDTILQQLQTFKKSDLVNESQHRESILSQCVQFCEYSMQHGRHAHVATLFNFIHVANSDDKWLPTAFNRVFPHLLPYYDMILASFERDQTAHQTFTPPSFSRLRKSDVNSVRLMSAIFELCVDFCDVMHAGEKLSVFLKPLYTLICIPDFQDVSMVLTDHGYALNEVLRSAAFALSNFVLSFTSLATKARKISKVQVEGIFKTLSCAPELSIQRSLMLIIRSLYDGPDEDNVMGYVSASELSVTALKEIIERKLSTTQYGSGMALASFHALKLDDHDLLKNNENVIKLMFQRKRKALRCFSTGPCVVQMQETNSKRKEVIESASVEWNLNSVCVRDQTGNPIQNWPFFTISFFECPGKEARFTFDEFYQFPKTRVVLQYERTLKRNDRKIIVERIDGLLSMVSKEPTPRLSRKDPMHQPGHVRPVAVSIALQGERKDSDYGRLSEGLHELTESEEPYDGNLVETILSGFQDGGVFIRKRSGSRARSVEESRESSSNSEAGDSQDGPCDHSDSSVESTGVHDLLRDSEWHDVDEGHEESPSSDLSTSVKAVDDSYVSRAPDNTKARASSLLQSSKSGPRIFKRKLPRLERVEEDQVRLPQQENVPSWHTIDKRPQSEANSRIRSRDSGLSSLEVPGNGKKNVGKADTVSLESGEKKTRSEPRKLGPMKRIDVHDDFEAKGVIGETFNGEHSSSSKPENESGCLSSDSMEASRGGRSVLRGKEREKDDPPQGEESMEIENIDKDDHENLTRSLDEMVSNESRKAVSSIAVEAADTDPILGEQNVYENVYCENERMREMLMSAVKRMLKCQIDSAQRMLMLAQKEVKLLQNKKRATNHELIKDYESKVKKFGEEQKERVEDYGKHHGALISKARGLARDLKVKLAYGKKQLRVRKQRAQRIVARVKKQLETVRVRMDDEFKELLASSKKREDTTKSSLAQNLMSMLGSNHQLD